MTTSPSYTSPSTSPSLLLRACDGEATAWQRIVQIYGPLVYNWARRTGLHPQDAADATQDTFAAVSARLRSFDSERAGSTFRGWLWTITRNKSADLARMNQSQPVARGGSTNLIRMGEQLEPAPHLDSDDDASDRGRNVEQQQIVRRTLAILRSSFEKNTWQAFWRTTVDGCTPDDVAQELGVSRWAVYKARSRVLQRLRCELHGFEDLP